MTTYLDFDAPDKALTFYVDSNGSNLKSGMFNPSITWYGLSEKPQEFNKAFAARYGLDSFGPDHGGPELRNELINVLSGVMLYAYTHSIPPPFGSWHVDNNADNHNPPTDVFPVALWDFAYTLAGGEHSPWWQDVFPKYAAANNISLPSSPRRAPRQPGHQYRPWWWCNMQPGAVAYQKGIEPHPDVLTFLSSQEPAMQLAASAPGYDQRSAEAGDGVSLPMDYVLQEVLPALREGRLRRSLSEPKILAWSNNPAHLGSVVTNAFPGDHDEAFTITEVDGPADPDVPENISIHYNVSGEGLDREKMIALASGVLRKVTR